MLRRSDDNEHRVLYTLLYPGHVYDAFIDMRQRPLLNSANAARLASLGVIFGFLSTTLLPALLIPWRRHLSRHGAA